MCTRFVYNGIDKIVGFNFDIDLSVWDHTVITEENRFYIGIKMPDGMYHSFHGINKNGNVGTLLYVHGNENARYIESEDCITISELTEKFIKAEISFDKALDIVKKKKIIYAPDATMQAMLSDKKGRVLIIEPGIGYRYEQENFSLITNYSILKPDITKPYIVSGDTRYEVAKELLAGYDKDFSVNVISKSGTTTEPAIAFRVFKELLVKKYAQTVTTVKHITPHKLRSTYGTNLYQESQDIYLVADVLGHKDVNTTRKHYAEIVEENKRSARNIVKLRKD